MSEYFKAAARCDIAVVRKSPLAINEKDIIEEEMKQRQFDTLIARQQRQQPNSDSLDSLRQHQYEERAAAIRREEKRQEAIAKKELQRMVKEEQERRRIEALQQKCLAEAEHKKRELAAEREQAALREQQAQVEAMQRRMKRAFPKSVEEQAAELPEDPSELSYMERLRMEKERLGRMDQLLDGQRSVKALYSVELPPLVSPTQLQRDIMKQRDEETRRIQWEDEMMRREEKMAEKRSKASELSKVMAMKAEHEEWLAHFRAAERAERAAREAEQQAHAASPKEHPLDTMHRQVQAVLLAEMEAQAVMEDNWRAGYSHLDRLEEQLEVERGAWREENQWRAEMSHSLSR